MPGLTDLAGTAAAATPYGAIAQGIGGLIKGGIGLFQNKKANKLLKNLQYPTETIPTAIRENKALAEQDAAIGLPQEQYNNSVKNIKRNQLASLSAGADRRTGLSLISALNDNANQATGVLDAKDAAARMQNKIRLQNVNNAYGNWEDKVWQNNIKDKYNRDYNYAMSLKGAGNTNLTGGLDSLTAGGLEYGASGGFARRRSGNSGALNLGYASYAPSIYGADDEITRQMGG